MVGIEGAAESFVVWRDPDGSTDGSGRVEHVTHPDAVIVTEPGGPVGLAGGGVLLAALARRRRRGATTGRGRRKGRQRTLFLTALLAGFLTPTAGRAAVLFDLVVDPGAGTPIADATGRHTIVVDGVPAGPAGVPPGGGTVVATHVLTPDGRRAALFTAGWLEIVSTPETAADFLFAPSQDLTIEFWFRSPGNGVYDDVGFNPDRLHAIGLGDGSNNLDVDLGDVDLPPPTFTQETALWTYFGSGGAFAAVGPLGDRLLYLDDAWHHYSLVRAGTTVTVYLDGVVLDATEYSDALGSVSVAARNYIGRASVLTEVIGEFPWFGYIGGVRVFDEAVPPALPVPSLGPTAAIVLPLVLGVVGALAARRSRQPA